MEALSRHLRHTGLGIVIVDAGLTDLGLQVGTILAGRLQSVVGGLNQTVGLFGLLLSFDSALLSRRDLVGSQIVEAENLVGQLAVDTCQFALQSLMALYLLLIATPIGPCRRRGHCQPQDPTAQHHGQRPHQAADGFQVLRTIHGQVLTITYPC